MTAIARRWFLAVAVWSGSGAHAQVLPPALLRITPDTGSAGMFHTGMPVREVRAALSSYPAWTAECSEPSNGWPFFGSCVVRDNAGEAQLELRYHDPMLKAKVGGIEILSPRFRTADLLSARSMSTTLAADGRDGYFAREQGDGDMIEPAHFVLTKYPRARFYAADGKELREDRRARSLRYDSQGRVPLSEFNRTLQSGWPITSIYIE
jgi:hypothetical protein